MTKKIYSAPAITAYGVETEESMLLQVSKIGDLDDNEGGDYEFSPETEGEGEGEDAGRAW